MNVEAHSPSARFRTALAAWHNGNQTQDILWELQEAARDALKQHADGRGKLHPFIAGVLAEAFTTVLAGEPSFLFTLLSSWRKLPRKARRSDEEACKRCAIEYILMADAGYIDGVSRKTAVSRVREAFATVILEKSGEPRRVHQSRRFFETWRHEQPPGTRSPHQIMESLKLGVAAELADRHGASMPEDLIEQEAWRQAAAIVTEAMLNAGREWGDRYGRSAPVRRMVF